MNIVRLNMAENDRTLHQAVIDNLRKSYKLFPGPLVAIAIDTKGPHIKITGVSNKTTSNQKAGK